MSWFRRQKLFAPTPEGNFEFSLPPEIRHWLISLTKDVQSLATDDTQDTRRLFPTAYPDDPDRDAGYQILARDHLMDQRDSALALMEATADESTLTEQELGAWMRSVNDIRLVLGTRLDVSEDDPEPDFDSPSAHELAAYETLGAILHHMVDALTSNLPPVTD